MGTTDVSARGTIESAVGCQLFRANKVSVCLLLSTNLTSLGWGIASCVAATAIVSLLATRLPRSRRAV